MTGSHCYIDSYQDAPYSQPEASEDICHWKKYTLTIRFARLHPMKQKLIYGVQANLWAEYIQTDDIVNL